MLQPDFDPAPTAVRIHRCDYVSKCKKRGCMTPATLIAEKVDGAGRHIRQIELCTRHGDVVIESARRPGPGDQRPARRIASCMKVAPFCGSFVRLLTQCR